MSDKNMKWETPLSEETFQALLDLLYKDTGTSGDPIVGSQLEFMERNGFDFGNQMTPWGKWLDSDINDFFVPAYIDHWNGPPLEERVPADVVREIGLQLRQYYRDKFNLPPLTDTEKANWLLNLEYVERPWKSVSFKRVRQNYLDEGMTNPIIPTEWLHLTENQVKKVAQYMKEQYPEEARYIKAVLEWACFLGYGVEGYDYIGYMCLEYCIDDSIEACFGSTLLPHQNMQMAYDDIRNMDKYL